MQIEKNDSTKKLVDEKNGLLLSSMVSDMHMYLGTCERKIEKEDFYNSQDSYDSNERLCLEKVEDKDIFEEVERHRELLTNLEGTIKK